MIDISLEDIQEALEQQIAGGDLAFAAVTAQVSELSLILAELPPVSVFPIGGAKVALSGTGAAQTLSVTGTLDWGLLNPTGVAIAVTVDPTASTAYVASVQLTAPSSASLSIPGVPWFELGHFTIAGVSQPLADRQTELLPQAVLTIGTTLTIKDDSSNTSIPITVGDDPTGALLLDLNTSAVTLPSINDVLAAFGPGANAFSLPATIDDLLSFSVEELFVRFDPSTGAVTQIGVQIGKEASDPQAGWPIIPGYFTLDDYTLGLNIVDPLGTALVGGMVSATGSLGSVDIGVAALHPATGGWSFNGYIGKEQGVPIGELVSGIASQFKVAMPNALSSFTLNDFEFAFDSLTYDASGHFSLDFDVNGTAVDLTVKAALTHQDGSYQANVDGKLTVGTSSFDVSFDQTSSTFEATWSDAANPLEFEDIATRFGFEHVPSIPPSLDLKLVQASITYDFGNGSLKLAAQSKTYGKAVFVAYQGNYFFGIAMDHPIDLTDLPLIKSVAGAGETVGIDQIQAVVSSAALDDKAAAAINALVKDDGVTVPATGMAAGAALSMCFSAGAYQAPFTISTGDGGTQRAAARMLPAETGAAGDNGTVPSSQAPDGTVWYDLQKKFGPVSFQKVGIRYRSGSQDTDAALFVLVDASLEASALTIAVLGLGVGSPLTKFSPEFTIDGVAVSLEAGPVQVAGGLVGAIDPPNLYGELALRVGEFGLSALGGYAEYEGHPSFFLYAVVNYPIGGPAFFFVTGVAAGLGFNRALVVPDVSGVAAFPLVAWAQGDGAPPMDPTGDVGTQVADAMTKLSSSGVIAPAIGSYWLALGVRFTSFELVDAFALLTVTFGTRFEVDLLGVATVSLPPEVEPPIARVELELEASFAPSTGLLAIAGQLTENSYVLDPDAHLTGGFAFYTWFAGEHEGEFLVTLGGYNPNFTVPDYYPKVPPLGLNWQVVPELKIQGDLYFALTSNVVMAGGQMSATWSSGPISAWFTVWADFLMTFQPFHYSIGAGIDLGASFTVKILFVHVSITIHVGVGLQIWGPPFAGVATVDLSIISFDIGFGSGQPQQDTTLPWDQFVAQLLPSTLPSPAHAPAPAATAATPGAAPAPAVVQVGVAQGLVKTLDPTPASPCYLVNAETFQCQVSTVMPFKTSTWAGIAELAPDAQQPHDDKGDLIVPNTSFSGGISGISAADFQPNLEIDVESDEDSTLCGVRTFGNAPKALWETKAFVNGVPQVDPGTGLTDSTIPDALNGYVLIPEVPPAAHTLEIPLEVLQFTLGDVLEFSWSSPEYATTDSFTDQTVADTITDTRVADVRDLTLKAMAGQGLTVGDTVSVASLADPANDDLMAAPALSLLGEQRTGGSP